MKRGNTKTEQQYASDAVKLLSTQTLQKFYACKNIVTRNSSRSHFPSKNVSLLIDCWMSYCQEFVFSELPFLFNFSFIAF